MSRTVHMCVDIAGVLRWSDRELQGLFSADDGSRKPGREVRDWLRLQLAHGKRVLPMGEACEGFSYQTGCPGHESPDPLSPVASPSLKRDGTLAEHAGRTKS